MKQLIFIILSAPLLLAISSSTFACDDKACETAYLAATTQTMGVEHKQQKPNVKLMQLIGNEETMLLSIIYSNCINLCQNELNNKKN